MLQTLQNLFFHLTGPLEAASAADTTHQLQLSTAVLLVEVMRADTTLAAAERQAIVQALGQRFQLSTEELSDLIAIAQDTAQTAYDYQRFTSLMNERYTQPQKVAVIESMWMVAYADAHLDAHENHVISKVAGLLHVTHGEYISAKIRAKEAAALPSATINSPSTERTPDNASLLLKP